MDSDQTNLFAQIRREHDPFKLNAVISAWENNPDRSRQLVWIDEDENDEEEFDDDADEEIDLDALRARDEYPSETFVPASEIELDEDPDIGIYDEDEEEDVEEDEGDDPEDDCVAHEAEQREEEERPSRYNLRSRRQRVEPQRLQIPDIIDRDLTFAHHDARDKCICCQERRVFVALHPCGHSCVCLPCIHRMQEHRMIQNPVATCLACGTRIQSITRI